MSETSANNFMILDDNSNNALFWEMTITGAFDGAKVTVCRTGYEALEVAKTNRFDFFISSWELEPMSGLVFMQKLREQHKYKFTPFLIFSNVLTPEDVALAEEFGITNFLLKPFEKIKIVEKVQGMYEVEKNLDQTSRLLRKIEDYITENKVSEALKLITATLKPGPQAARAYSLNGDIWARTEHTDKAEKSYGEALKFDANFPPALNGLGKLYLKQKRFDEAVPVFEALHNSSPRNLMRMVTLGGAYLESGDETKAEAMFKKVRGLDDSNTEAAEGLGKVNFNRGNIDLAAKFFRESGKGDELASYFNNMAITNVSRGRFDEGIEIYKNAMKVLPDQGKFHLLEFNIGLALKKSLRAGMACEAFARSLLALPSYEKAFVSMNSSAQEAQTKGEKFNQELVNQAAQKYKAWQSTQKKAG